MKRGDILLSEKYGANPAIPLCYFCQQPKNEIILAGKMGGCEDIEAPQYATWDMNPCDKCAEWMKKGILLISVRDGEKEGLNPYRTGKIVLITEEGFRAMIIPGEFLDHALKVRFCFVSDTIWNKLFPAELTDIQHPSRGPGRA